MAKATLNIGLKTYLDTPVNLYQVRRAVAYLAKELKLDHWVVESRVEMGEYEGWEEDTAVIQIEYDNFPYWWDRFCKELCVVLCQDCVAIEIEGLNGKPIQQLHYHPQYKQICYIMSKTPNEQNFNPDLFIHYG